MADGALTVLIGAIAAGLLQLSYRNDGETDRLGLTLVRVSSLHHESFSFNTNNQSVADAEGEHGT